MDLKSPSDKGGYATSSVEVTQDGNLTKLFKTNQYLFLIPPADNTDLTSGGGITAATDVRVQVDYDIVTVDNKLTAGHSKTSTSATISLPIGTLKRSKAYEYILTIGLEEVKVSATVSDWANADQVYIPSVDVTEVASATNAGSAITSLNTIKGSNQNCNYFVVNFKTEPAGATDWSISATTTAFKLGDQIELKFPTSTKPSSVTLAGWTVVKGSSNNFILTKNN